MTERFRLRTWRQPRFVLISLAASILFLFIDYARSQEQQLYLTTNTLVARALAMGGAYVALEDALAAGLYNPANAGGYRLARHQRVQFFLNPVTPALAFTQRSSFFGKEEKSLGQTLASLGLLLKGFTLRVGPFDVSTILGEQASSHTVLAPTKWETSAYRDNQYSTVALRMRLADRVSVGGSLGLYYVKLPGATARAWKILASYGITLAPSQKVLLGVSYLTVPTVGTVTQRDHPERIADNSVNLGLSYRPVAHATMSFDLRNVVEDGGVIVRREPHLGLEYTFHTLLALRCGAFYKREEARAVFSAGLGLLDLNWPRGRAAHSQYSHWALNYGIVAERLALGQRRVIHALTVAFRI